MAMDKAGQRRILLIEDDAAVREMIALALTNEGYAVQSAADGAAALALIEDSPPDVILLDMKIPVTEGWAFAAQYEQQFAARVSVIVLTAAQDAGRRRSVRWTILPSRSIRRLC